MSDDLINFLRARLAEEQVVAETASPWPWRLNAEHDTVIAADGEQVAEAFALSSNQLRHTAEHIARWDPARVLRQTAAMRAIVGLHERLGDGAPFCITCDEPEGIPGRPEGCDTLRHLGAAYADHPDYRAEWRP